MTAAPTIEPDGPRDEQFVYTVTPKGVEALRRARAKARGKRVAPAAAATAPLDRAVDRAAAAR